MFETVCKYICSVADLYFCPQYISGGPRRRHTTGAAELVTPKLLQSVSTQTWCGSHRGDVNTGDSSEYLTSEGDWNDNIRTTCGHHIPSSAPCLCESLMIILVLDFGSKLARSKL